MSLLLFLISLVFCCGRCCICDCVCYTALVDGDGDYDAAAAADDDDDDDDDDGDGDGDDDDVVTVVVVIVVVINVNLDDWYGSLAGFSAVAPTPIWGSPDVNKQLLLYVWDPNGRPQNLVENWR